jgi:hypothetical protein
MSSLEPYVFASIGQAARLPLSGNLAKHVQAADRHVNEWPQLACRSLVPDLLIDYVVLVLAHISS